MRRATGGYFVHAYTASGVGCGWLALVAAIHGDARTSLLWLSAATFINCAEPTARWRGSPTSAGRRRQSTAPVSTTSPLRHLRPGAGCPGLAPGPPALRAAPWVIGATLIASALGFARRDAKTDDHLFTGFPSYWNVVAVYLIAVRPAPPVAAGILLLLAALVFVPIRYVYPSRTVTLRPLTVSLGAFWGVAFLALIWQLPDPPAWLVWVASDLPGLLRWAVVVGDRPAERGVTGPPP